MAIKKFSINFLLLKNCIKNNINQELRLEALWSQRSLYKTFFMASTYGSKTKSILSLFNIFFFCIFNLSSKILSLFVFGNNLFSLFLT